MSEPALRVERRVEAPPERVYAYFTDPELWSRWQGTGAAFDARPGGELHIRMGGSVRAGAHGRFVTLEPPHRLVLTWGWIDAPFGPVPPGSTTVESSSSPTAPGRSSASCIAGCRRSSAISMSRDGRSTSTDWPP